MRQDGGGGIGNSGGGGGPIGGPNPISGNMTPMQSGGPPSVQSSTSSNMDSNMTPSHALEEMHHMTFAELY